jgi:hypothetical protein
LAPVISISAPAQDRQAPDGYALVIVGDADGAPDDTRL